MSMWRAEAKKAIDAAHARLPAGVSFADRRQAIDAAYPFGPRQFHPYKMWLKERKAYLARYDGSPAGLLLSPLDRAKAKFEALS